MAPFPEAEIMTIKRLEVALRKMDFKLLKEGAYKLHEKYHGGYRFEYLNLLKEIYNEVIDNPQIPFDVRDILCPTIEDIVSADEAIKSQAPDRNMQEYKRASNPIPVANSVENNVELNESGKINVFDAFGASHPKNDVQRIIIQSPFSAKPFVEQVSQPVIVANEQEEVIKQGDFEEVYVDDFSQEEITSEIKDDYQENETQNNEESFIENKNIPASVEMFDLQANEEVKKELKNVAIIYAQDSSNEKIKNIFHLRELLLKARENALMNEVTDLISEISTQANSNVIELQGILEQIKKNGNKTSLITNSQSALFAELFEKNDITYEFYKQNEDKNIAFLPLFGLVNLFSCSDCSCKHYVENQEIMPLVLQCPKCKSAMFPELYAPVSQGEINLENYNSSLVALANSKVWLLIHPSFNGKVFSELIESACKVSSNVEEIYIIEKDINVRETYRSAISKIKPEVKINIQSSVLEDFLNTL